MAQKKDKKYTRKLFSNTQTYKLTMSVNAALILFCILLALLYVLGSYQNFLTSSQIFILKALSFSSLFTGLLSFILAIETVVKIFTEKYKLKNTVNLIFLIITVVFCTFCLISSSVIRFVATGA